MTDLRVVTPAAAEPVTLAEAKYHLRLIVDPEDGALHEDDAYVQALIPVAREVAENFIGRPIALKVYELRTRDFRAPLPVSPVDEVLSVQYVDGDGSPAILDADAFELAGTEDEPYLRAAYGTSWPAGLRRVDDAVRIRFRAGYGGSVPLPSPIRQAMLMLLAHLYENRESTTTTALHEVPHGAMHLLAPYRIGMGV